MALKRIDGSSVKLGVWFLEAQEVRDERQAHLCANQ